MKIPAAKVREGVFMTLTNAETLLKGGNLLLKENLISGYALLILSLEEIGKSVLLWKCSENYTKDVEDDWWRDHSKKLDAAFWFHRGMVELESLGINLNIQAFLKRIKCEREDSLYVNWNDQLRKWVAPIHRFDARERFKYHPRSFDSIKSLLNLAEHILDGAKRNL